MLSKCEACVFFRALVAPATDEMEGFGNCRRFPPKVVSSRSGEATVWPKTHRTEYCGEFKRDELRDVGPSETK